MNLPDFGKEELREDYSPDGKSFFLRIPAVFSGKMDWFDGHFDFQRIFPGVGQLYVITFLAEKYFGVKLNGEGVCFDMVKYSRMILPDTETVITLTMKKGSSLNFVIADAGDEATIYSQGKCSVPEKQ